MVIFVRTSINSKYWTQFTGRNIIKQLRIIFENRFPDFKKHPCILGSLGFQFARSNEFPTTRVQWKAEKRNDLSPSMKTKGMRVFSLPPGDSCAPWHRGWLRCTRANDRQASWGQRCIGWQETRKTAAETIESVHTERRFGFMGRSLYVREVQSFLEKYGQSK